MKEFMIFVGDDEVNAVYAESIDHAEQYMKEFAKEPGTQNIYIYQYVMRGEVQGLVIHDDHAKAKKSNGLTSASRKSAPDAPARNRKKWTESEQATIINCVNAKTDPADIAQELNRTEKSVRCRISILRSAGRLH